jgi:ribosomal protein S18 acetylase RimI-like enzyme
MRKSPQQAPSARSRTQAGGAWTISRVNHLEVAPLDGRTWKDLASLFSQGGDPKRCWCMYWRLPSRHWSLTSIEANRNALHDLAESTGPTPGLIAFRDGEAVGWVSLGPREDFPRITRSRTIPLVPGEGLWSIVCFVVSRRARRSGVATALLDTAVEHAQANGAQAVEAYPVVTRGSRITSASAYTGTLGMFERAGFAVVSPTRSSAGGGNARVVVRRDLDRAGDGR